MLKHEHRAFKLFGACFGISSQFVHLYVYKYRKGRAGRKILATTKGTQMCLSGYFPKMFTALKTLIYGRFFWLVS